MSPRKGSGVVRFTAGALALEPCILFLIQAYFPDEIGKFSRELQLQNFQMLEQGISALVTFSLVSLIAYIREVFAFVKNKL